MKHFPIHQEYCNEASPLNKVREDMFINSLENK